MNYKEVIESRYNRQNWQLLLHDIFGNKIKFWNTPSAIPTSSQFAKQALWLGSITLSDNQTISIYEVELSDSVDIERNRRGIRDMLLTDWRNNGNAGAFMFCYRKNESVLRFSYVSEAWTFAADGSYQKESTDAKRFTYLLGEGHRSRTAIQQFEKLRDSSLTLKDLTKAFSVDAVSDMFFDGYKKQYEDIIQYITGKRMVKVANKWEERQEGKPNEYIMQQFAKFDNQEKAIRDYVKKLMGRLVFLQFLQKKGWLGVPAGESWGTGDREFIQNLFANCQDKDHFIDNVLEVLFNDLNTERKGDLATPSLGGGRGRLIPYLNGGLFERDATDETEFPLPGRYMQSLLDFFASYNFTIDENDPDDAEVGVDPEMLGRIFENLLEDNKDKGVFYTPKEIVSYMCRESLIAYLQTDIEDEATKDAIRQFVTTHEKNDKLPSDTDQRLKDVKICDPAIGSGAFPMGLLKELFQCRTALEGIEQSKAAEIKKHIIQNNIYGVDIEKGAVDIARLRFWLSLIVDEETPQALPNLDFKIMQGNSLLEQYKGVDLSTITELKTEKHGTYQTTMFDDMIDVLRLDLRKKLDEYYSCPDHKKKAVLKKDIIDNVKQQLKEQSINVDFGDLDLSGNNQFMLWHTWFYDVFSQGGFDIVIGNPPYVSTKGRTDEEKENIESAFGFVDDLYHHFIIHSFNILRDRGIQSMITSDTYFTTLTKTALRKIFLSYSMLQIVHWGHDIFDDALVSTATFFCQKCCNDNTIFTFYDVKGKKTIADGTKYIINQRDYSKSINGCFYVPTPLCLGLNSILADKHNSLMKEWWAKIETSKKIAKNESDLNKYRSSLEPGDLTFIGLVTDGGVGLQTGDNGRFVGVKAGTKQAVSIIESRPQKLAEVNRKYHLNQVLPKEETEIWKLFDRLKSQLGNKIFGQGYVYRIVSDQLLADITSLSDYDKEHGISGSKTFVPYDKGDKEGNKWYIENPFVIDWSKENVHYLKTSPKSRYQGYTFYFKEGFCWNNNLNERYYNIKCKEKKAGIHDVASMSLFELTPKVPAYYLVTLINSSLCGYFYRMFLNNTVNVQVNDLRMLPIIVPSKEQLTECKVLFDDAIETQKAFFNQKISPAERDSRLLDIQKDVDKFAFKIYGLKQSDYPPLGKTLY
jgi:methylase of polypeptide subunit release factors